jgi:uncharacterized protein (DUF2336 family)
MTPNDSPPNPHTPAEEVATARRAFRDFAIASWLAIRAGDSKLANRQTDSGDAIVANSKREGQLQDLLGPLLEDRSPEVRYAAAAHLLDSELSSSAASVLERLQEDPKGLIAPTARILLMTWRQAKA